MTRTTNANYATSHFGRRNKRLAVGAQPAEWRAQAECAGMDPDLFFPTNKMHVPDEARAACARCPVKAQCLEFAIAVNEKDGFWGGKTPEERRKIKRNRLFRERIKEKAG